MTIKEKLRDFLAGYIGSRQHKHQCVGFDCSECTPDYGNLAGGIIEFLDENRGSIRDSSP